MAARGGRKTGRVSQWGAGRGNLRRRIPVHCRTPSRSVLCDYPRQGAAGGDRPRDSDVELKGFNK
jgi:hypothetical protein